VNILILLQHLSQIINIVFEVFALIGILSVQIGVTLLILDLFFHVFFVKADDALFKFLEVCDVMQALENVVLELLLETLLVVKLLSQVSHLVCQTLLSHSQVVDNESQILVYTVEMLKLLSHFVSLLIKLLDFDFAGSNVTFKFLDLVIEDELELF